MDLTENSQENVDYLVTEIKKKLNFVNEQVVKTQDYSPEQYEALLEIYEMIKNKSSISVMEKEAVISELGSLRNDSSK